MRLAYIRILFCFGATTCGPGFTSSPRSGIVRWDVGTLVLCEDLVTAVRKLCLHVVYIQEVERRGCGPMN